MISNEEAQNHVDSLNSCCCKRVSPPLVTVLDVTMEDTKIVRIHIQCNVCDSFHSCTKRLKDSK